MALTVQPGETQIIPEPTKVVMPAATPSPTLVQVVETQTTQAISVM
jgi:hypothetical protein